MARWFEGAADASADRPPVLRRFPQGFAWGAATSSYQIEGAAREDGKGESIWDRFVAQPGHVTGGHTGDIADDHYHRAFDDVDLMRQLGLTAYRFSIAWPRVQPNGRGPANERGIAFYERLVDKLLEAGIDPWITLYHWDLPASLEDAGGWPARDTADAFADYAALVSGRLADRVRHWFTINEPWEIAVMGYGSGEHAPGRRDLGAALQAAHVVLLAHGLGARAIRANQANVDVGLAIDMVTCYPDRDADGDRGAAFRMDGHLNRWFLDPLVLGRYPADMWDLYGAAVPDVRSGDFETIATPIELIGLNYYYSAWVREAPRTHPLRARVAAPHTAERTALGWAIHEQGMEEALLRLARKYGQARLVISESGASFRDTPDRSGVVKDVERARYHERYLCAALRAIEAGVPVEGYFAWSLLDNFEWQKGYGPRFGLVRVDYRTLARTAKLSGAWYGAVARANALLPVEGGRACLSTSGSRH
jgi:beta-glucosidase